MAACAHNPDVWRDLGIELLGQDGIAELDMIKANNSDSVTKCCSEMLTLWRQRQTTASWNQLIEALVQVKLNRVAEEIRKSLKSPKDKMADTMQAINITPTQQQDHAETKQGDLQVTICVIILGYSYLYKDLVMPCSYDSHFPSNSHYHPHTCARAAEIGGQGGPWPLLKYF